MLKIEKNINRDRSIDGLKGIAIIVVVLYHLKICECGYLGVDIFFVIAGFLTALSVQKEINDGQFKYFQYLFRRLFRLMPLVLVAGILCEVIGFAGMLPDDYENLAASIVASNIFSNNILSAITTRNYWDTVNDYKPLMHLWYTGVLFEFYICYPVIVQIVWRIRLRLSKEQRNKQQDINYDLKYYGGVIICVSILSLVLFLSPVFADGDKFYFLFARFFEFGFGAFTMYIKRQVQSKICIKKISKHVVVTLSMAGLLLILFFPGLPILTPIKLIFTVVITCLLLFIPCDDKLIGNVVLAAIGKRSYSVFIWHQIFLAFYRYFISIEYDFIFVIAYLFVVAIVSQITYVLIENSDNYNERRGFVLWGILFMLSTVFAVNIYMKAGVVRDVPELDVYVNDIHRGMHSEYTDRIYKYDKDFEDNGKVKVFVVGWSYGRDFANILLESEYGDKLDLSFAQTYTPEYDSRLKQADYIFVVGDKEQYEPALFDFHAQYWGVGTKNFGESNGIIYKNRYSEDYYSQSIVLNEYYIRKIQLEKTEWSNYIDMMGIIQNEDGSIPVFTDDKKFISQDCRHLTEAGAKYYARIIDWDEIFGK